MTIDEFNSMLHSVDMWCKHKGIIYFIVSSNFDQALFGLIPDKEDIPADEWMWVRCENIDFLGVLNSKPKLQ